MPSNREKWFHVTFSTYGSWLPGDPRGFRTWKHTENVEGDYKNPPPAGAHSETLERSRRLMKRPAVTLSRKQRAIAGLALYEMLTHQGATVVAIAVSGTHVHIVVKLLDEFARELIGRAKKHAAHELRREGVLGGAWAKRCRPMPIKDRQHQLKAIAYVRRHAREGAWVWAWGMPRPTWDSIVSAELAARLEEHRRNPQDAIPWAEVRSRILKKL